MDKEISEWIDGQIRSRAHELSSIKKCGGPFCRNPDPLKEDLKILNRIKEELGAKGEAAQKPQNLECDFADREKAAMLAWLADQMANRECYIDGYDYYAKNSKSFADAYMLRADGGTTTLVNYWKSRYEKVGADLKIIQAVEKILMDDPREKEPKEKQILDDVEKRYLKSVIRPFKDGVAWVMLAYDWAYGTKVHLEICCRRNGVESHIQFPPFAPNAMYENMEIGKRYTLKELGLDD